MPKESSISADEALAIFHARWPAARSADDLDLEVVGLAVAEGRVLGRSLYSPIDLPMVRASRMDGVAVDSRRFADGRPDTSGWRLGVDFDRADTGDDFPDQYDAVIAIENCLVGPDAGLVISDEVVVSPGLNVSPSGSRLRRGELLAPAPRRLGCHDLVAIGSAGIAEVPVIARPKVGFVPTGSELIAIGAPQVRGVAYETNSLLAASLLRDYGAEAVIFDIVGDEPAALADALASSLPQCDLLILNAGSSMGAEDCNVRLLAERGELLFHWSSWGPGRPLALADVAGKPVVVVPGPPSACLNVLDWFIQPIVSAALQIRTPRRETVEARLESGFAKKLGSMTLMLRAQVVRRDGELWVRLIDHRSNSLASYFTSSALVRFGPGAGPSRSVTQ